MKKTILFIVIYSLFAGFIFAGEKAKIKDSLVVVGDNWPPFEFKNEKGEVVGISVDVAKKILDKLGVKYKIKIMPWSRALMLMKNGDADILLDMSVKEKRKSFIYYPSEYVNLSRYVFFVRKDNKKKSFKGYQDAKNLKVGIVRGYSYSPEFWKAKLKLDTGDNGISTMKKLALGRVDLFPTDLNCGQYLSSHLKLKDRLDYYDYTLFTKQYFHVFSKKSKYPNLKKLIKNYEKVLLEIKKNGEYKKIVDKYINF